jgi:Rrf2 family protein
MRLELTKRADYAIRTVLDLARTPDGALRSVRDVATAQAIPVRFLPQVMHDLVRAGLVEGVVGRAGGYRLTRPPGAISLLDIVEAVEGDSRRRACVLRNAPCGISGLCDIHPVFAAAQDDVLRRLGETSVSDALGG